MKKTLSIIITALFALFCSKAGAQEAYLQVTLANGAVTRISLSDIVELRFCTGESTSEDEEEKPVMPDGGNVESFSVNGVSFRMIRVAGGTFRMGATEEQGNGYLVGSNEYPVHTVTLDDYYIGETEVTQALWYAVMGTKPSGNYSWKAACGLGDNFPAYYVSFTECQEFVARLNALTGRTFRMPTEAEWEYAARGGNKSKGYIFSGGNNADDVAWDAFNSGRTTHVVAMKRPNELGIYDMSGNVWEWCSDWFGEYGGDVQTNPLGVASGNLRVNRGGCWEDAERYCRVAFRASSQPISRSANLGLRLAR